MNQLNKNHQKQQPKVVDVLENKEKFTEIPFMPKMANETLKAQLGNASWKLFHTILARYPDEPSDQERNTLKIIFIYLLKFIHVEIVLDISLNY